MRSEAFPEDYELDKRQGFLESWRNDVSETRCAISSWKLTVQGTPVAGFQFGHESLKRLQEHRSIAVRAILLVEADLQDVHKVIERRGLNNRPGHDVEISSMELRNEVSFLLILNYALKFAVESRGFQQIGLDC
jgi:hypothetical protein